MIAYLMMFIAILITSVSIYRKLFSYKNPKKKNSSIRKDYVFVGLSIYFC